MVDPVKWFGNILASNKFCCTEVTKFEQGGEDLYDAWARGERMGHRHTTGVGPEPRRIVANPFSGYFPHFF